MADYDVTLRTGLDTKDVEAQADKLRSRIEGIFNKTDGKKMSSSFVRLKQNLRDLYAESERISGEIAKLDAQKVEIVTTKEYSDSLNRLQKLDTELNKIKAKMQEVGYTKGVASTQFGNLARKQAYLMQERTFEEAERLRLEGIGKKEIRIPVQDTQRYKDLVDQQAKLNDRIQIGTIRAKEMQNTVRQTVHPFREMHNAITKVTHAINKVISGVKTLINRLRGVNTGIEDTKTSMRKLLKFAMKYFLGLRSIFILYKRIRSAGVEAYKGLASQFPELNAELNELKNSFFQLKNSIATMAQPILSYLVPAIKTLMGWLSAAMTALANFFAILTGAKYIYKATKLNKDWAKSAKGAGKAAKDANEDIAEYDNLILIQQDKNNGGGGGGGAADDYAGAWEKVEAESDFAQKLKDAINAGNWEEVGALFADKLNGVVNKVDNWIDDALRPQGKKWADRIARILNGFTDRFDGKKLGATVANGVNTAFEIVNTFLKRYNFRKLGTRIGETITGFFTKLDPKLIGNTLANKFNAAINFWGGLITSTDFKVIGSRIGVALKTLLEDIQWSDIGANLFHLAAGILESLSQFIIDSNLGVTVGNAINEFLSKIDFGVLMKDLSDLAINILNALADAIETIDWEMVGQAIADLLKNIDWGKFLATLLRVAVALIKGIGTALLQIAKDPEALRSLATGLLAIFGAKWLWSKITGLFTSNLTSALGSAAGGISGKAIGGAIAGVITYEVVGRGAGNFFANAFEGTDLESYYREFSQAPITYTVNAVSEAISAATEVSERTGKSTLRNAIEGMADDWVEGLLGPIKYEIPQTSQEVLDAIAENHRKFDEKQKALVEEQKKVVEQYVTNSNHYADIAKANAGITIATTQDAIDTAKHYVDIAKETSGYNEKIKQEAISSSNHYAEIAKANAKSIVDSAKEAQESSNHYVEIAKTNSGYYDKIQQDMIDSSNHYVEIAKKNAQAVSADATDMVSNIEGSVSTIPDSFDSTFTSAYDKVTSSFDGTKSFFTEVAEGVKSPFGTMADYFHDTFSDSWKGAVSVFQTNKPEFKSIQDNISGSFKTMINGMITGVNNSIASPFKTLSSLIEKMRGLTVGDNKVFSVLPSINVPTIPKLAQGAVLPPNNPFIAMVGDQKSGTNVEAPLETIAEALRQVLSETQTTQNQTIVLQLNGRQIAQAVWDEENKRYKQTGARFSYS